MGQQGAPQLLQARLLVAKLVQAAPYGSHLLVQRQQRRVRRAPRQQLQPPPSRLGGIADRMNYIICT